MAFWDDVRGTVEKALPVISPTAGIARLAFGSQKKNPLDDLRAPQLQEFGPKQNSPEVAALRAQLGQIQGPQKLGMENFQKQAIDLKSLPEFEGIRQNLKEEANQAKQQQKEALQRRFASLGSLQSGASLKAEQQAENEVQKNLEKGLREVGFQEAQGLRQQRNILEERQFQAEQQAAARNFQREIYNADSDFKDKVFRFDANSKLSQLDLAFDQAAMARITAENDRLINQYNAELSKIVAGKKKPGLIGGIVGEGGLFSDLFG